MRLNKIKMRILFSIIFTFSLCAFQANAQKVDSDELVDRMKSEITNFYVEHKMLRKEDVNGNLDNVFAIELKDQKVLGYSQNGIYRIGVFQSHTSMDILIKENSTFKIFDTRKIEVVLKRVIEFSEKNNLSSDDMLFYIKSIVNLYEVNNRWQQKIYDQK
jgi:hypothetical protein